MSKMLANIKRIVEEDIGSKTTYIHALNEAIINAIQANARNIICRFTTVKQSVLETPEGGISSKKVTAIEVEDDGDGFNNPNFDSFSKYRSDYKMSIGCKGVGRFVFLKLFEKVTYTSWLVEDKKKIEFSFSYDFDTNDLHKEDSDVQENKTLLKLSGITDHYFNKDGQSDRRLDMDISKIKEDVLTHLIPMLFLHKQEGVNIRIEFHDDEGSDPITITDNDIPDFKKKEFVIKGTDNTKYSFTLYYTISETTGSFNAFHCANKRTVCKFSDHELKISLPDNYMAYFLLESEYFDQSINNERNNFDIFPIKTDLYHFLSWEMINSELKNIISTLVKSQIPNAIKMNHDKLIDIQKERPYLAEYIEEEDLNIAGFIDKDNIIKKAKKRFDNAKENLLLHAGKTEYTNKDLDDAIQITQNELVAYVKDRVLVIEQLKTMLKNQEQSEKIIHNLFMERYTEDNDFCFKKNNLWLLDDRFTSYSYAASDKRIKEILESNELEDENKTNIDRPDLALFFSHDPANKEALKSVLIELKSFKDKGKSSREKFMGIQQLLDYIKVFKDKEDIKEIWAFLVTDVDEDLGDRLTTDGYIPLFTTGRRIYYRYYDKIGSFIYVFGVQTLILDAEARNKIFIDIINKNSSMNKLFSKELAKAE